MSFYLSVMLEFDNHQLANDYAFLLSRDTRPLFDDDVPNYLQSEFDIIDQIEYPDVIELNNVETLLVWDKKEQMDINHLVALFKQSGVSLILAHQINDYADASDDPENDMDGVFIFTEQNKFKSVYRKTAIQLFSKELIERLSTNIE